MTGFFCAGWRVAGPVLLVQQQLQDDAGGNCNQNIVATGLNPMVTTGRRAQVVTTPVINHVLPAAVLSRQTPATVELMVGAGATFTLARIVVRVPLVLWTVRLACLVVGTTLLHAALCLTAALCLSIAVGIVLIVISTSLGERISCDAQRHRQDGGNNCFTFHAGLH